MAMEAHTSTAATLGAAVKASKAAVAIVDVACSMVALGRDAKKILITGIFRKFPKFGRAFSETSSPMPDKKLPIACEKASSMRSPPK